MTAYFNHNGNFNFITSLLLGMFAFFGEHIEIIIRLMVALGSMATAFMACRNYYFSIKKNKKELKNL